LKWLGLVTTATSVPILSPSITKMPIAVPIAVAARKVRAVPRSSINPHRAQ
jgi:hypothetical protein